MAGVKMKVYNPEELTQWTVDKSVSGKLYYTYSNKQRTEYYLYCGEYNNGGKLLETGENPNMFEKKKRKLIGEF